MSRPVSSCRIGVAGAGKTLSCVIFACTEFLPFEEGRLISNLPFLPEKIAERYAGTTGVNGPMSKEEIVGRFEALPPEVLREWSDEKGGPWEYFEGKSIVGAHIMLDEAHNFVGKRHTSKWRKKWQSWIGELRHQGATIEFVSQAQGKLAPEFLEESERQVWVVSSDTRREPVFGIEMGDIYQLLAKLLPFRGYQAATWVTEKRNAGGKKYVVEKEAKFRRDAKWFELYESYNAPTGGGTAGRRKLQYELLGWPGFLRWFLVRNLMNVLMSKLVKVILIVALLGTPWVRDGILRMAFGDVASPKKPAKPATAAGLASVPPTPTLAPGGDMVVDANRATQAIGEARNVVARSDALTPDKRDEIIAELTATQQRYIEAFQLNTEFVGLVGDELLMRNGERYAIDEPIRDGPLMGRSVTAVDRRRRELLLDDGRRLKLGGLPRPAAAGGTAVPGAAGVQRGNGQPRPGTGFPQAVRRDSIGAAGQAGSQDGAAGNRGAGRGGAAGGAGVDVGPVGGFSSRGPLSPPYAPRTPAPVGDGR